MEITNKQCLENASSLASDVHNPEKLILNYGPQSIAGINVQQTDQEETMFPFMYGHDKWPHKVERAFTTALRLIMKSGTSKIKIRNKNYGRNELISLYIRYETGEVRTKKQISSHIQVWKKSILSKASSNMRLTPMDAEILSLIERGAEQNKESLERFYSTFEVIIDTLSKDTTNHKYSKNSYTGLNASVTKLYPQSYNRNTSYGNDYNNMPPTIMDPNITAPNTHGVPRYQYSGNMNPYVEQQPSTFQNARQLRYAPIENYSAIQNDPVIRYSNNDNANNIVGVQRTYSEYYNVPVEQIEERYSQPYLNNHPGQVSGAYQTWFPGVQLRHQSEMKEDNPETQQIGYLPQYSSSSASLTPQVSTNQQLTSMGKQIPNTYLQPVPNFSEPDRVKLPHLVQHNTFIGNQPGQFNTAYTDDTRGSAYPVVQNKDFRSTINAPNIQSSTSSNDVTSIAPIVKPTITAQNSGKFVEPVHDRQGTKVIAALHEPSIQSEIPMSNSSRIVHTAPYLYRNSPAQQNSQNIPMKQPMVMVPSYPYYSQNIPGQIQRKEENSESLPGIHPK
ncbi:similar to Saccharomyces cerevisiae YBR083W TEC1 Transcription factor required for full Ty1 expression [Maudiozyma saulgeensis]|uniref:Similar to Saccharomyces cerevisiae YBR083W TEC1 Transcription factor required for full Ty1 expression n=1 Tax=Maudiozyma saulgeensis TaxID=1789683 RepID=A0A1X7R3U7_9SACH|nr:similar to Saccharomyces cerevisiae YBR083W TEC1 Transcription factor required for full Ty1 expression [Kazachstania saulgeensis]